LNGEHRKAAAVIAFFTLVFLWTPLWSDGLFAPADITASIPLLREPGGPEKAKNPIGSDVVLQILPFLEFNKRELAAGRIPLWNPYAAGGAPHLANYQSALFSLWTVPFYLVSLRTALIVSCFLKLFASGFLTYLFLRRIGLSLWTAVSGGVLFMFSGNQTLWLHWHNPALAVTLPASAWCCERLIQAKGRSWAAAAGLTAVWIIGILAGHPETFYFCSLALGAYLVFRLTAWPENRAMIRRVVGVLAVCTVIALAAGAVQWIPFTEYLANSAELHNEERRAVLPGLSWSALALQLAPDLFGNPVTPYDHYTITNYNELNSAYTGAVSYLLLGACPRIDGRTLIAAGRSVVVA